MHDVASTAFIMQQRLIVSNYTFIIFYFSTCEFAFDMEMAEIF